MGAALNASGYGGSYVIHEDFIRRAFHSSAILENNLYIDGGEEVVLINASPDYRVSNKTLLIDLSLSWTNDTVVISAFDKPADCPTLNYASLSVNPFDNSLYSFGGEASYIPPYNVSAPVSAWRFPRSSSAASQWLEAYGSRSAPFRLNITRPLGASTAASQNASYYLGGFSTLLTSPQSSVLRPFQDSPLPGMVIFDYKSATWTNKTSSGYSYDGTAEFGGMLYVQRIGLSGALVMLGGDVSPAEKYIAAEFSRPFDNITIYDIESDTWYGQTATGDIPIPRFKFCVVGAQEGDNSTYEIFMYGGWNNVPGRSSISMDQLFVLSLPAFHWFQARYVPTMARHSHTCHVVGNRQLLSIGGSDPEIINLGQQNQDQFTQGLGIFDLSDMKWTSGYNASALPYVSPEVVKAYIDQEQVSFLFMTRFDKNATVIVGSSLGSFIALLLLSFIVLSFKIRWRRKVEPQVEPLTKSHKDKPLPRVPHPFFKKPEIDGNQRLEMFQGSGIEMGSASRRELGGGYGIWPWELGTSHSTRSAEVMVAATRSIRSMEAELRQAAW